MSSHPVSRASVLVLLLLTWSLAACVGPDDDDSADSDDDDTTEASNDDDSAAQDDDDITPPCDEDADGDGYIAEECGGPDCDDSSADVNPDQSEVCADGIDNNCDGASIGCGWTGVVGPDAASHVVEGGEGSAQFGTPLSIETSPDSPATPNLVVGLEGGWDSRKVAWYEFDGAFSLRGSVANDGVGLGTVRWLDVLGSGEYLIAADASHTATNFGKFGSIVELVSFETTQLSVTASRRARIELVTADITLRERWWCLEYDQAINGTSHSSQSQTRECGDLTGDGVDDLCIGAHGTDLFANPGGLWVFDPLTLPEVGGRQDAAAEILGDGNCDQFGWRLAGGADLTGDGLDDLVATTYQASSDGLGMLAVFAGPLTGSMSVDDAVALIHRHESHAEMGANAVEIVDLNSDGAADIVADVRMHDAATGISTMEIWGWYGPFDGDRSSLDADVFITPRTSEPDVLGWLADAGDVDADGFDDFLVNLGYGSWSATSPSGVCLLYGPLGGQLALDFADFCVLELTNSERLGSGIAGGADFNGDGFDDFAIGARMAPNSTSGSGLVYVFMGEARQP